MPIPIWKNGKTSAITIIVHETWGRPASDLPVQRREWLESAAALLLLNDADNQRLANTIVALITQNTSRSHEPTQLHIDLLAPGGRHTGLIQNSVVVSTNLFTASRTSFVREIGSLPLAVMTRIDDCLMAALGLP